MSSQYGELRLTNGWDLWASLGHPCKFQRISRLGSVTARHSSGRQPNFAAFNRGRHLYSAGRPSRWALAHISSYGYRSPLLSAHVGSVAVTKRRFTKRFQYECITVHGELETVLKVCMKCTVIFINDNSWPWFFDSLFFILWILIAEG